MTLQQTPAELIRAPQDGHNVPSSTARPAHAIVIGAGFGGLAAAIRLGARGYKVTLIERNEQVGGRASVYEQDGFKFDAGPTIITVPFIFEELWALCGKTMSDHVTMKQLEPCYTIRFDDGTQFKTHSDHEKMRAELARFCPEDLDGFERYFAESKRCYEIGFEGLLLSPFHKLSLMAKNLPNLIMRRADRSVHALVKKYIKNEKLRMALSFHPLFLGGNPLRATAIFSLVSFLEREYGVHYVMGGTGALVKGMADLVAGQGGQVILNSTVDEILLENDTATGVRLASGEEIAADIVVSNTDVGWMYNNMLPGLKKKRWTPAKIKRAKHSMSLFVWYFGTDKRYEDVDHHTILMGPRYDALLKDIFDKKVLAEDFSLYLYRPTATDTSVAPEGCDGYYVLSPVPNLDGDTDWTTMAETYRKRIEKHLSDTIMPDLADHVISSKVFTPLDFESRLLSVKGAAFGMEPILTQTAWFRPHNISETVKNLFLVGAGTHPGAGVPGVVSSAKILDEIVPDAAHVGAKGAQHAG